MQSRRARLPELLAPLTLAEIAAHPGLVVADPGGDAGPRCSPAPRGRSGSWWSGPRAASTPPSSSCSEAGAAAFGRSARLTGSDRAGRGRGRFGRVSTEWGARRVQLWVDRPSESSAHSRATIVDKRRELVG